jgi:hypothetical protein
MQRPHQAGAGAQFRVVRIGRLAGVNHRPAGDIDLHGAQHRDADLVADAVGLAVDDFDAMGEQEFERRDAIVGKGADDLAVVIAIGRKAVALDHRPVGKIAEKQIGRILDAVFLLVAGAAAERQVAARGDGMTADARLCLHDDHRGAGLARHDRGRHPRGARADDDDIGFAVPLRFPLRHADVPVLPVIALSLRLTAPPILCHVGRGPVSSAPPRFGVLSWQMSSPPTGSPTKRA